MALENLRFMTKVDRIEREYDVVMKALREECKLFDNIDVIIPKGQYKGRRGRVTRTHLDDGKILALIMPYRLKGQGSLFLDDTLDARTFWELSDVETVLDRDWEDR